MLTTPCEHADRESALLEACAKWLQRAEAVVGEADHEVEALLQREGHASMAPEWVTFVNKTVHLLREIEQVSHAVHARMLTAVVIMVACLFVCAAMTHFHPKFP